MARRKIRDEAEARDALGGIAASGEELSDWCSAKGIDPRSLNGWRGVLAERAEVETLRFVELVPTEHAASPAGRAEYRVRCGAFTVEVGHFDDDDLARLLRVVAAAC